MRSSDALKHVLELERHYDVVNWRLAGVRVWPLLRIWLHMTRMNRGLLKAEPSSIASQLFTRTRRMFRAQARVATTCWMDRRANARLGFTADAVFYSDGVNFVNVGGLWYDKLFDPIIGWVGRHGGRHLLLTPMANAYRPRRSPSRLVQPRLDLIKLLALLNTGIAGEVNLPGFEAAMSDSGMNRRRLFRLWNRLCSLSEYFHRIVTQARPARAFVNTYYSIEGMAFVLACRRCGVPVADVQHGLQGDYHVAYGQWLAVPAGGFELLPDEFWVWGNEERDAIDRWRPRHGQVHLPVVTGNPWLDLWRGDAEPNVAQTLQAVQRLRRAATRCCVLITLGWGMHEEETLKMLRAVRLLPAGFQCWVRLHPMISQERAPVRAMIERCGLHAVEIDAPTDLPLHALLRVADVHVTHSSSTVIEAAEFGVPSVVCSDYGAEVLAAQVAAGAAVVAKNDADIARAIVALSAGGPLPPASRLGGSTLEAVLVRAFPRLAV